MSLDDPAVQRFLGTKQVALLATVKADGAPLAMPMWFLHDAASVTMISVEGTQKVRNLRRDPRVCVVAEAGGGGGDIRGVTVLGRAEFRAAGAHRAFSREIPSPGDPLGWPGDACEPRHVQDRA
jgi:general stress protein 26